MSARPASATPVAGMSMAKATPSKATGTVESMPQSATATAAPAGQPLPACSGAGSGQLRLDAGRVAVLFAMKGSTYHAQPNCEVYDLQRDALSYRGGLPVVAHPPCRSWGQLRQFAHCLPGERAGALWAVAMVQRWGGVLEHPRGSSLFDAAELPKPGEPADRWGGYTVKVNQCDWGHMAQKATWLYVVRAELPPMPPARFPTHCIGKRGAGSQPEMLKSLREWTPPEFGAWLLDLARSARPHE